MKAPLKYVTAAVTGTTRLFFWGTAFLVFGMAFAVFYEVTARYLFNAPTIWATEISGYLYVALGFLAAAYVLHLGAHIRVSTLVERFPPRLRRGVDAFTLTLALVYAVVLCWQGWKMAWRAYVYNWHASTPLGTPIFYPMLPITIGAGLLSLQLLVSIYGLIRGKGQ